MPWVYSRNHSQVDWSCRYLGIMDIKGLFTKWDVNLDLPGDDPSQWKLSATIDATSMESAFGNRDETFRGAEWLDTEHYPTITFAGKRIERTNGDYRVSGDVTIKGVTKPVTMDMTYQGEATDRRGARRRIVTTEVVLPRSDFNVGPPREAGNAVGQDITIHLQIEGVWQE